MNYLAGLPGNCPPATAVNSNLKVVYRLVDVVPPTSSDFKPYAMQGLPCPAGVDACRWASCSLSLSKEELQKKQKLPKFKKKTIAKLSIPLGNGVSLQKKKHIDFWAYAGASLETFFVEEVA